MENSLRCPYCESNMKVTEMFCPSCKTTIKREFSLSKFNNLTEDQLQFCTTFIIQRGNLKELEKIYNLSYPTLRNRLNSIASVLSGEKITDNYDAKETLSRLENGELSVNEAISLLKNSK